MSKLQEFLGEKGDNKDSTGKDLREFLKLSFKDPLTPKEKEELKNFKKKKYTHGPIRKAKY